MLSRATARRVALHLLLSLQFFWEIAEVLLQRQIIQSPHGLKPQPVLQTFECFLDAPAPMIERAESGRRIALGVQQRAHQHTHPAARRDATDQAHGGGCTG